jgi:oligosaccharide repeat unit polymerase
MSYSYSGRPHAHSIAWFFWAAFAGSCFLFWWLESTLLRVWMGEHDPIQARFLWISAASLILFTLGYLLPAPGLPGLATSEAVLDRCVAFSYVAAIVFSIPAFWVAIKFVIYRLSVGYLEGHGPSLFQQAALYTHLFLGLLYIGAVRSDKSNIRKIALIAFLTIFPRLLVALRWRRFFLAQAVLPIIFIAIGRGWLKFDLKRIAALGLIAVFILFIPAITRGDKIFGTDELGRPQIVTYFGWMTTLNYVQDNLSLRYTCPPLLVSLTAKLIPYSALGLCTIDIGNDKGLPATMERLLTKKYSNDTMKGTGGNYLLELYLAGGYPAIALGATFLGFTCRRFVELIDHRSLYAGIWAECLGRALLAPRGTLGYVYERIPSLLLATFAVIILSRWFPRVGRNKHVTTVQ